MLKYTLCLSLKLWSILRLQSRSSSGAEERSIQFLVMPGKSGGGIRPITLWAITLNRAGGI